MLVKNTVKRRFFLFLIAVFILSALYLKLIVFAPQAASESTVIERGDLSQELTLSGEIDAEDEAVLQFQTGGKLAFAGVKEGDWVQEGQIIASLDKEKLEAALRQDQADFIAAKAEHEEYYDGRTGDSESYDEKIARTALDAKQNKAYDDVRIAEENLKNATLYSPIEGLVVKNSLPLVGTNIYLPSQAQVEIVSPNTIFFSVNADQTEVVSLKEGQSVEINLDSYPSEKVNGTIKSISFTPNTDETGTVYKVKIQLKTLDNSNYKYRLGMTGDATFITETKHNSLYLPLKYVKTDNNGSYVFTGSDKKKAYIKTGLETDSYIEILKGLNEGDKVYD